MFARKQIQMVFIVAAGFLSIPVFADAPFEAYHVAYKNISKEVLQNAIGILTINSGSGGGTTLRTYIRMADRFVADSLIEVLKTTPISNFGYHPPAVAGMVDNYRYPIIETIGPHARIVFDPVKNLSSWIDVTETKKDFDTEVLLLSDLSSSSEYYLDIFCFTQSGRRKIYKSPARDAEYFIAAKSDNRYELLRVLEIGEGYVKLGRPRFNKDSTEEVGIDPVGWIRIRDDEGRLTFWINMIDNC